MSLVAATATFFHQRLSFVFVDTNLFSIDYQLTNTQRHELFYRLEVILSILVQNDVLYLYSTASCLYLHSTAQYLVATLPLPKPSRGSSSSGSTSTRLKRLKRHSTCPLEREQREKKGVQRRKRVLAI